MGRHRYFVQPGPLHDVIERKRERGGGGIADLKKERKRFESPFRSIRDLGADVYGEAFEKLGDRRGRFDPLFVAIGD